MRTSRLCVILTVSVSLVLCVLMAAPIAAGQNSVALPRIAGSAALAFQVLGERSLDYPNVGKFIEFWLWSHPTIRDRVIYAQTYTPWDDRRSS
jgi:hypothetical protein